MSPVRGVILLIIAKLVEGGDRKFTSGNIAAGVGYSGDSQQAVSQRCYNATVSSISAQQAFIQLDTSLSFSELENKLGISVSIGGKYGIFSAEAKASYLRSVQDKDYSISLNYYHFTTNNVAVQIAGLGDKALTESGRDIYSGGKNPYFGLLCGDYFITSYQQGALLTMGLNIKFSSSNAKTQFEQKAGASFGDIFRAAESIENVVTENKITGSITIQAFQMGGEPSQLAKVLNKDSTGQYYALSCSLTAMQNCIKAASGLLDYAKDEFSNQISFENNTGLTPLGISFSKYLPIKYIGLIPPASLVTPEVVQHRNDLFGTLKENEYYQEKLYPFFNNGYPVELDADFLKNASSVLSKANHNVGVLMQAHEGAADCFNFPDMCKNVKDGIDSQLQNITIYDLKFLEVVKYTITIMRGTIGMAYNTGRGPPWWQAVPNYRPGKEHLVKVNDLRVSDEIYRFDIFIDDPNYPGSGLLEYLYTGYSSNAIALCDSAYCGELETRDERGRCFQPCPQRNLPERKRISPFFFDVYNTTK